MDVQAMMVTACWLTLAAPATPAIERLGWMAGSWASDSAGVRTEEHWAAPAGGLMVGMNRSVRPGRRAWFEFLRIEQRGDTLFYVAQPGGAPATEFRLSEQRDRYVRFENPAHDFPQRILYWLDDRGALHARAEGELDGRAQGDAFRWKRAALTDGGAGRGR